MGDRGTPADASALIYLAKARALEVAVTVLGRIVAPQAVWREVVEAGDRRGEPDAVLIRRAHEQGHIKRQSLSQREERRAESIARRYRLGQGESQLLAIAKQGQVLLLDDVRAVRVAGALGYSPVTTVSLPILGLREGKIEAHRARTLVRQLAAVIVLRADVLMKLEASIDEEER